MSRRPVLIAGPTASGKSHLALALAERDDGIVINADAQQVYAGWRILTARPGPADLARAPHALYGHVAMDAVYSAGAWLRDLAPVLARAARAGRRPIIVGGTGLYFAALTEGLAPIPPVPAAVRARALGAFRSGSLGQLSADLARRDPETHARLDLRNPMRVMRAWEVLEATGRGLAAWQRQTAPPLLAPQAAVRIVISPPPAQLSRRIAARLEAMVAAGALDEVARVLANGWRPDLPSAKALGAAEFAAHLQGVLSLEAAITAAAVRTRRFAKRQRTWLRARMADWRWFSPDPAAPEAILTEVPEA